MKKISISLPLLLLLSACGGGGGKLADGTKSAGLTACDPSSGPSGTVVTCEAPKGVDDTCTFFFGKVPVEFTFNDGAVSFKAAGLAGDKEMHFQCGDSGIQSLGTFTLTSGTASGSDEVAPAGETGGGTTGDSGEVIAPSGTGGGTTGGATTGGEAPPPDADGDGVADASDACPGTPSGATVDSTGCPPAPPQPTSASIDKFEVTPSTASSAKMSTYNVSWTFTNAKAAYLFGNILNRDASDAALAEADRCKLSGTRYLVTGPDGNDINKNLDENAATSNLKKANRDYLEGILCDNGNSSDADNCLENSTAMLDSGIRERNYATEGRFNDVLSAKDRYGYKLEYKDLNNLEVEKGLALKPDVIIPLLPAEDNPQCRIDLKKKADGTLIPNGQFTTRSLVQYGKACLAVQGSDDKWVVKCKSVTAKPAEIEVTSASMKTDAFKVSVNFTYAGAVSIPSVSAPAGCSPDPGPSWPAYDGPTGTIKAVCDLSKTGDSSTTITASAHGIGQNNVATKKLVAALEAPKIDFDWNNSSHTPFLASYDHSGVPAEQDSGKVEFKWSISRKFKIKEDGTGTVIASGDTHWIDHLEFIEWNVGWAKSLHSTKNIGAGDDYGIIKMNRNHHTTGWSVRGYDFGASKPFNVDLPTEEPMKKWLYEGSFSVSGDSVKDHWVDECDQCCGGWDCDDECGPCAETSGTHMTVESVWSGSNIKKITSNCGQLNISQPGSEYGPQTGSVTGQFDMGNSFPAENCEYTAEFYDGTTQKRNSTWNTSCDSARCISDN